MRDSTTIALALGVILILGFAAVGLIGSFAGCPALYPSPSLELTP